MAGEWESGELEIVLDEYFEMLRAELSGEPYVKAEHNRKVQNGTGRAKGSVEFKFQNISAVLQDLELVWVAGYKPRSNYQLALRTAIERRLADGALDWVPSADGRAPTPSAEPAPETGQHPASDYVAALRRVPERAFGGADVAVAPDRQHDPFWPEGPAAPGANEVVAWLRERVIEEGGPVMAFLVGGPGNGKSFLSASIVQGLPRVDEGDDGLAHRAYAYSTAGRQRLRLINDATISPASNEASDGAAHLIADIGQAFAVGDHLVANVNRGILFEELSKGAPGGLGYMLAQWLHGVEVSEPHGWSIETVIREHYLRSAIAHTPDGSTVEAVAVFMDACSLFERRPEVTLSEMGPTGHDSQVGPYKVARFDRRVNWEAAATPAAAVLAAFVAQFPRPAPSQSVPHDPFAANLTSLSDPRVQRGVVDIMRAAELATSKRFTYRELWGAIARLVIGDSSNDARAGWGGPFELVDRASVSGPGLKSLLHLAVVTTDVVEGWTW